MKRMVLPALAAVGGVLLLAGHAFTEDEAPAKPPVSHEEATFPVLDAPPRSDQKGALLELGARVYDLHCTGCHGVNGDGAGPAARFLFIKPRDFTKAIFKFRSTPSGTLPTDEDLYRTISRGINGTSMPTFSLLSERERIALVEIVKEFGGEAWDKARPGEPIYIPEPPQWFGSDKAVARGAELYDMLECWACHGKGGKGDGPSSNSLEPDAWGNPQHPFDFTQGSLHGGPTVKDVYRTFMTGIYGTAMPSYADIFGEPDGENIFEGDAWNLVSYIVSLRQGRAAHAMGMVDDAAASAAQGSGT